MQKTESWRRGDYEISTELERLDFDVIRNFLATSYWAAGVPREIVAASCRNSLCFGLYHLADEADEREATLRRPDTLVGFARTITDYTTFAYLADVFVLDGHRGAGLSKWMMTCVMAHPELQGLRRFMLATRDAHTLYERYGFRALSDPAKFMEIARPGLYRSAG